MGIESKLDKLKDKLKDFIEEKTWYAEGNPILDVVALDLKIRLALFLIDLLDGKLDKAKRKYKLEEEHLAAEEKERERKFLEALQEELKIQYYLDWIIALFSESAAQDYLNKKNQHAFIYTPFYSIHPQCSFKPKPVPAVLLEEELSLQFNSTVRRLH